MPAASTHEYRVLVVDDCESLRYLKTHYLLEAGYRVSEAGTGTGAIRSIEADRPDLVLLDVNLPDMHGSEVCREVKMRWALPVVYTSSVDIPAELHGTSDGCLVSLEKAELLDTVRKALEDPSKPMPQPNGRPTEEATGISCTERSSSAEIATQARIFEAGLLREVMDASGASTIVLNGNRQIIFCSRAALTLAGVGTSKAALGLRLGELFHCVNATKSLDGCSAAALCESCQAMAAVLDRPWANIDGWE
jgi:CheY-like chemotaxis protein